MSVAKKRIPRPNLIERAFIEREWHQTVIDAQIHALYGDNPQGLVETAGRVLFVVLKAANIDRHDFDQDDLQSIHEAVISMYDQVDDAEVCPIRRTRILCGLEAAGQLLPLIQRSSLIQAACGLKEILRKRHIHLDDFDSLIDYGKTRALVQNSWSGISVSM